MFCINFMKCMYTHSLTLVPNGRGEWKSRNGKYGNILFEMKCRRKSNKMLKFLF